MCDFWFVVKENGDIKIFNSYRKANSYCGWRFWKGIKYLAPCRAMVAKNDDLENIIIVLSRGAEMLMDDDFQKKLKELVKNT